MSQDERAHRNAVERFDSAERAIERDLSEIAGKPTHRQKEIIDGLVRLQHSLRGPEDLLDKRGYSRPVPPANHYKRQDERERALEDPFGRAAAGSV